MVFQKQKKKLQEGKSKVAVKISTLVYINRFVQINFCFKEKSKSNKLIRLSFN